MLLQIMEEGTLTDARGRKVDFRNTIIILTSNVGAEEILRQEKIGFANHQAEDDELDYKEMQAHLMKRLRKLFRPEFLNRVDEVVVFRSLSHEDIRAIVNLEFAKVRVRVQENDLDLSLTDAARDWLVERGYSKEYGARPLKRLIQKEIETPLSDALLSGEFQAGDTIRIDVEDEELVFEHAKEPEMVIEL